MGKSQSKQKKKTVECKSEKIYLCNDKFITVLVLGAKSVGKSSYLNLLTGNEFKDNMLPTIGLDKMLLNMTLNMKMLKIKIYDTSGDERFRKICLSPISYTDVIILMYDMTNKESFIFLESLVNQIIEITNKEKLFIVIQNKSDLLESRKVSIEEGQEFAEKIGGTFWELSSKDSNHEEAFKKLEDCLASRTEFKQKDTIIPRKVKKPIIYLYPDKDMNIKINIKLLYNDCNFLAVYPKFNGDTTWDVFVNTKGEIFIDNHIYPYLFWEAIDYYKRDFSQGFIVESASAIDFLEEKLSLLGLNYREKCDFITYWLPTLIKNKISICSFQFENYTNIYKLNVDPKPDNLIRIFLAIKKINNKEIIIKEQILNKIERKGFTVVEWGGCNEEE